MKKKLLSLLLVLLMLASLLPASALAANKTFGDFFAGLPLIAETEPGSPNSTKKWKVTTLGGEDVLMSGNKGKSSSSSTLQLTMTADTNLIFEYKVSTEKNYDKLTITQGSKTLVNGVSGFSVSGNHDSSVFYFIFEPGFFDNRQVVGGIGDARGALGVYSRGVQGSLRQKDSGCRR